MERETEEVDPVIPIKNVYYMLSYAFQSLKGEGYRRVEAEEFKNAADLCAEILCLGVSSLLKSGLGREYYTLTEPLSALRGRIDIAESLKTQSILRKKLVCSYDAFTVDSKLNRIIKSTMELLLRSEISQVRRKKLKKLLVFLMDVQMIDLYGVDWHFRYDRNNQTYRMLIGICELVVKGLLQTQSNGTRRLMDFFDEQRMSRLYEKFILEYYRTHFPQLSPCAAQVPWDTDDDVTDFLPVMQSDVTLSNGEKILIIDAKYYSHTLQSRFDARTIHSNNLYQIFTYVKNKAAKTTQEVSGMLLYARTDEAMQPDNVYQLSGNTITVRTLDLNCEFKDIAYSLDTIANILLDLRK